MTTTLSSKPTLAFSNALMTGVLSGVVAAIVNVIIYYMVQSLNGGPLIVQGAPLPLVAVLLASLLPGLAAGGIYWALPRFTSKPTRWFLTLAGVVLVMFGSLTQATGLPLFGARADARRRGCADHLGRVEIAELDALPNLLYRRFDNQLMRFSRPTLVGA